VQCLISMKYITISEKISCVIITSTPGTWYTAGTRYRGENDSRVRVTRSTFLDSEREEASVTCVSVTLVLNST